MSPLGAGAALERDRSKLNQVCGPIVLYLFVLASNFAAALTRCKAALL